MVLVVNCMKGRLCFQMESWELVLQLFREWYLLLNRYLPMEQVKYTVKTERALTGLWIWAAQLYSSIPLQFSPIELWYLPKRNKKIVKYGILIHKFLLRK